MTPCFEDCLFDTTGDAVALRHYMEGRAALFAEKITHLESHRTVTVLDAGGKSQALAYGLAMLGYDVYSAAEGVDDLRLQAALDGRMRTQIRPITAKHDTRYDVIIAGDDLIADYLTEADLQHAIHGFAAQLDTGGHLLISVRQYDQLLRTRPASAAPLVFEAEQGRCALFRLWHWIGSDCRYQQEQYLIRQNDPACNVVHRRSLHRAWRRAEINLVLLQAGFDAIQYQTDEHSEMLICARRF